MATSLQVLKVNDGWISPQVARRSASARRESWSTLAWEIQCFSDPAKDAAFIDGGAEDLAGVLIASGLHLRQHEILEFGSD
jgi:hypothetical protein